MHELVFIVNPVAANGKVGKIWPRVREYLESQKVPFDFALTEYPTHAITLAWDALQKGASTIVAFGGDGTLNEVLNGVFREGPTADVAIGAIPGGTGSDFTRSLDVPRDPVEAVRCILRGRTRLVDVGEIRCVKEGKPTSRYFINVAGLGFDAEVAERSNRMPKFMGGTIPYLFNLVVSLFSYRNKNFRIRLDDRVLEQKAYLLTVAIGKYFGGGMFIAPDAGLDDGLFDVIVVGDMSKPEFIANVPRVYKGTHIDHPKVDAYKARRVEIHCDGQAFIEAEGEIAGMAPAEFTLIPQAVKVLC